MRYLWVIKENYPFYFGKRTKRVQFPKISHIWKGTLFHIPWIYKTNGSSSKQAIVVDLAKAVFFNSKVFSLVSSIKNLFPQEKQHCLLLIIYLIFCICKNCSWNNAHLMLNYSQSINQYSYLKTKGRFEYIFCNNFYQIQIWNQLFKSNSFTNKLNWLNRISAFESKLSIYFIRVTYIHLTKL